MFIKKNLVMLVLCVLVFGPISFVFFQALEALGYTIRLLCTGVVVIVCLSAGWFLRETLEQMGVIKYWLLGFVLLFGFGLWASTAPKFQSSDFAQINYSDGTQLDNVRPTLNNAWGRVVGSYDMHPAYGAAVVPNSVVATFLSTPKEIDFLVAKPPVALFQKDGKPIHSDGVSIELNAYDAKGELGYSKIIKIPQDRFLKEKWIKNPIQMAAGIASVKVTVGWRTPESTPSYGSTIVGFEISNWHAYFEFIGKLILVCFGCFVLSLFLILNFKFLTVASTNRLPLASSPIFFFTVLVCLLLFNYFVQSETTFVYYWDLRNYWSKTEVLYELIKSGSWMQAIGIFSSAYTSDYSMLPAVWPALISLVTGYPTRLNYSLSITAIYAVPAYIMVAYLAKRLVDGQTTGVDTPVKNGWVLASFTPFFALPIYFGTTLSLMPDIGGVILFVGALLIASTVVDAIREPGVECKHWQVSRTLVRSSISLGVLFSLMFIFRRWYVFAAAGIACSLFFLVIIEISVSRGFRVLVLYRAVAAALLVTFAALPLLCWVLFDWSRDFGQHDYANLYSSYKFSLDRDAQMARQVFGVVSPFICVVGGVFLYYLGKAKRLLFLLFAATGIACFSFLSVQSPALHHYYLLMPMLGAFLAGLSILIARRFGLLAAVCFTLLFVLGGTLATRPMSEKYGFDYFAGFEQWLPRHQKYVEGYTQLYQWLALPANESKKFCLIASSETINQGVLGELWQVVSDAAKGSYDQRLIQLGQVDSVNGPPGRVIQQCQIFLIGVPFQAHLQPDQQFTLEIIQKDILNGEGIGQSVDRSPTIFSMGDNIEVRAYQAVKSITDDEYEDLVKRFVNRKALPIPK